MVWDTRGMDVCDKLGRVFVCPLCLGEFSVLGAVLRCPSGHSFDVARQGYVSMVTGAGVRGDTAEMVKARESFLRRGHYLPIAEGLLKSAMKELEGHSTEGSDDAGRGVGAEGLCTDRLGSGGLGSADLGTGGLDSGDTGSLSSGDISTRDLGTGNLTADAPTGLMADLGGGTGWYSQYLLDRFEDMEGVLIDGSRHAARVAARAHPRLVVGTADLWKSIPLRNDSVRLAMVVFAPRNPAEIERVLCSGGVCLVVSPGKDHLSQLRSVVPLLGIEQDKQGRLLEQFSRFTLSGSTTIEYQLVLSPQEVTEVIAMGPTAYHSRTEDIKHLVTANIQVTISVVVHRFLAP